MSVRSVLGKIYVPVKYFMFKNLPKSMWSNLIRITMKIELGESINLKNPQTFNEKVQWLKLHDQRIIKTILADKYEVREWISKTIGEEYLIPLLGVWDEFEQIDFDLLPKKFVLKATHGCGCNIVINDKSKFDFVEAKAKFKKWYKINYAYHTGELHYEKIKPRIIAEQYLENAGGDLYDYKVFCFNGKAKYIMYLCDRKNGLKMAFYNTNWEKQPFTYSYPQMEEDVEKPDCLEELIKISEKISKGFDIVRVDFYILNDGSIKFGEVTLASAGGYCKWFPKEYNAILGEMIELNGMQNEKN